MKRNWMVPLLAAVVVSLCAGVALADEWDLLNVPTGERASTYVYTTEGPDYCRTKIASQVSPSGVGVAEVWVGGNIFHSQTELNLPYGQSANVQSAEPVDLRSSSGALFQGDVGDTGQGTMSFQLLYPDPN